MQQILIITTTTKNLKTNKGKKRKTFLNLMHSPVKLRHTFLKLATGGKSFYTVWHETTTESREVREN